MRLSLTLINFLVVLPAAASAVRGNIRNLAGGRKGSRQGDFLGINEDSGDIGVNGDSGGHIELACPEPRALMEPPLAGVYPGVDKPKVILAQDVDYPPYAQLGPASEDFPTSGFGPEFAEGLTEVCDIDMVLVQTQWSRCWQSDRIGEGLALGEFHACTTYSHASGVRNRYLEFSDPILNDNKAAGILTRLENGVPVVDGNSNLDGVKVVDVVGFAPTVDNLAIVTNDCTGEQFSGYEIVPPTATTDFPNDDALRTLLDGTADAMWVYADQVERFQCANNEQPTPWDCSLWDGLGTEIAYVQTGMFEWARAGTTLTIAKKGAGVAELLNPCIKEYMQTESYYNLCEKYEFTPVCYPNSFFPANAVSETSIFDVPTDELTTDCSSGYCPCPSR